MRRDRNVDPLARRAVFQRILDQVLEHADQFVAVAEHMDRLGRRLDRDRHVAVARQRLQAIGHLAHDRHEIDLRLGPQMRVELDARERQQIIDQARHAGGLRVHDAEKALARGGVVARRALQGFDETRERRQRRAQLMARIGDEVGAHRLDALDRREIVHGEQDEVAGRRSRVLTGATTASDQRSTGTRS